tara:strand:+ start:401 stop:1501 length:1101 start_codon:yes stop_codon:yes gene_type:complete
MAKENKNKLKGYFETGDVPTQQNYADLIDSKLNLVDLSENPQTVSSGISASYFMSETLISAKGNISGSKLLIAATASIDSHITASGNISSSLSGSFGFLDADQFGHIFTTYPLTGSIATFSEITGSIAATNINLIASSKIKFPKTEVADGKIVVDGSQIILVSGSVSCSDNIFAGTHITASGNISASGFISSSDVTTNNLTVDSLMLTNRIDRIDNEKIGITFGDGINVSGGHVTASGNITSSGNIIADGTGSFQVLDSPAFIGSRPIQTKTGDGALVITDAGTYNRCGAHKLTIPLNSDVAFTIGTEIDFIQTAASGHLLVTASAGEAVTLNSRNQLFSASGQFSAISCKKVGTDEWDIIGDLTA